jgi:rSAM/selenodomain-associated transferase 1
MATDRDKAEPVTVAVFARAPVPGQAKTRLVPLLGPQRAARLHALLVERALATATAANVGPVTLWAAPDHRHPFFAHCESRFGARLHDQAEGDLGVRMLDAFVRLQPAPVLIIGSDCPAMSAAHLGAAAEALRRGDDAVFLPAEDGGYGLVGLRRPVPRLFIGMTWGTAEVMDETRARLAEAGLAWSEPATVWDIDRPEDVARLGASGLMAHELGANDLLEGGHAGE